MNADDKTQTPAAPQTETQWQTVSEEETDETKIIFDTIGDEFIGKFLGHRIVENENGKFTQYRFQIKDDIYFTNAGYSLMRGMSSVSKGSQVRITYISDRETGQETPMRVFRVDVAKPQRPART